MMRNPVIGLPDYDECEYVTEKEFYKELQCEVVFKNLDMLCKNLEAEKFFPYFVSKKCLDSDACDQIRSENTNSKRVNRMIHILIRSCLNPMERLCKAINRQRTQEYISQRLIKDHGEISQLPENKKRLQEIRMQSFRQRNNLQKIPPVIIPPPPYTPAPALPSVFLSGGLPPYNGSNGGNYSIGSNPIQDQEDAINRASEKQNLNRERSPSPRLSQLTLDSRSWRSSRSPSEHDASLVTRSPVSSFDSSTKTETNSSSITSSEIYYPRQDGGQSWPNSGSEESRISIRRPPTENLDVSSSSSDEEASLQISAQSLTSFQHPR